MQYGRLKFSYKSGVIKTQKKCCSVAKQKQHTKNNLGLNNTTQDPIAQELLNSGLYSGVEVYKIMQSDLYK
jgi:hypothetical protein